METLRIGEIIKFGWETFKKRPWFFIGTFLVISIFSNLSFQFEEKSPTDLSPEMIAVYGVTAVVLFFVSVLGKMGGNAFLLKAHESPETVRFADIWAPKPFWRFVGTLMVKGIIIGLPLLIVMGAAFVLAFEFAAVFIALGIIAIGWAIYASIRFMFAEMIVMDKGSMPADALRESYKITEGHFWRLIRLSLAIAGVCVLGLLALVVGLLVAIPVISFAMVHAYRELEHKTGEIVVRAA